MGCSLERVGSLTFDHEDGACAVGGEEVFFNLCHFLIDYYLHFSWIFSTIHTVQAIEDRGAR